MNSLAGLEECACAISVAKFTQILAWRVFASSPSCKGYNTPFQLYIHVVSVGLQARAHSLLAKSVQRQDHMC
jgi:hypothetical protein